MLRTRSRVLAAASILTAVAFILAACGSSGDADPTATSAAPPGPLVIDAGDPIIIGVSAALSGAQAEIGQDLADAVDLAIEDFGRDIHGHALQSRREDDGCNDAEMAVAAAAAIVEAEAAAVVGPMCTTGAQAANDEYEDARIPHITPSATRADLSERGSSFFFRTAWRDDAQAAVQAAFLTSQRADAVVLVDDGDPYGRELVAAFTASFEAAGGQVLSHERLERGSSDFTALARQIIASGADAVVYQGLDPEGALLVRDLRGEGFDGIFMGPDSLFNAQDFIGTADGAAEEAVLTAGPVPDTAFTERFVARFGRAPQTSFVLQAYDAARIALTAIETASSNEGGRLSIDRSALAAAMRAAPFAGLTGTIRFGDTGDRTGTTARDLGLTIVRVTNATFEQVE